jgi:hypothetical protein
MVFCFIQNINFFCREIFFQNLTLGYMTKTLNQIIFSSSTKIRIFFSATLGIRIFFLEKNHNPHPLQVKWLFPYSIFSIICRIFCRLLFVLFRLAIMFSILLRFTDSDYPFGIFKLFVSCGDIKLTICVNIIFVWLSYP